uniref:Protein-tyrosine-phosphatase n=1 Tax=Amphimedon queenslandica TaxID=400682 RepID=A0A1X7UHR5_AMPQE
MTVSWDEVPCNGRNGPITGYYLTYTNITSNTSYTVNITGGDNRMYNLTGLIPYTNYTVSIIPYNYNMNGPARQEIQLTAESIPGVISDLRHAKNSDAITIVWNPPTIPNGIITVYEIRYRESTSTGPYNISNTTNTYYSIVGLIPNVSYTIGVRAYTSIGPGEWTNREYTTIEIPVIQIFSVTKLNSTAVRAEWSFVSRASHYSVYYESTSSSSRKKRQVETGMRVFPGGTTEGLIGGLDPNLNYLFSISTSFNVNGIIYEGERTEQIPPGATLTPTIVSSTSSVIIGTGSSSISYYTKTATMTTPLTTVLVNNGNTGVIVGLSVVFLVLLVLAIIIIIILVLVMHIKRTNINQKRKSDNDIVMECSPAYATTEFKTKSTVEPVYDTTNNEYETSLPPPAEYEIPTQSVMSSIILGNRMVLSISSCFILLIPLLVQLVTIFGREPPSTLPINGVQLYLAYENRIIPDYFIIYASQFYEIDQNNDNNDTTDALWCQSANNVTNIGVWYYPNGTEVPLFDGPFGDPSAPSPVYSKRFSGQIALARRGGLSGYEGLYKCIIPDENRVNQTLVVGAYTDTGYNNNDGPDADSTMQFSLLSTSRLATPPVFSLSFNVSDGPPTTVNCSVNGNGISTELCRVIVNGSGSVTRVTVTVRLREAGTYQCNASNARVTYGPISLGPKVVISPTSLNISVSNTPTSLTATRLSTGLAHVRLSWSTVSGATGYEVYYQLSSNTPVSAGTTASTTINITSGLFQGSTYTFYVVSYGSASLPSGNASVMITISNPVVNNFMATLISSTAITLKWSPPTTVLPYSYNINRRCRRVCESSVTSNSETSVSSPHTSTGIPPYSLCGFDLIGVYGAEIAFLTTYYLVITLSNAPTAPVDDIIFSSVESVSMTVSWDEVPCNGRNGPITGYYLTYTNITSSTSYTVNITGGDNRMYNLTGLIPYTNYTVSIIPYNYNMNGPARQEIQLTAESIPGMISDLRHASITLAKINISWNPPTIPNGIITVYEIRYRESTSTGPYNITNTTNTYYSIAGLIPNTSYTIGVRAYTSIGPGEWTHREFTTSQIPVIQTFSITKLSSTAVRAEWGLVTHYTVYYESTSSSSRKKRQVETGMRVFPGGTTEGLIGGLDPNLNYLFSISTSFNVNGIIYEGERTEQIPPIYGHRKSANDNKMECSQAYATTNTADDILMKDSPAYDTVQQTQSTVEPVYDTTNNEYETPLPPPTEYEIPTV